MENLSSTKIQKVSCTSNNLGECFECFNSKIVQLKADEVFENATPTSSLVQRYEISMQSAYLLQEFISDTHATEPTTPDKTTPEHPTNGKAQPEPTTPILPLHGKIIVTDCKKLLRILLQAGVSGTLYSLYVKDSAQIAYFLSTSKNSLKLSMRKNLINIKVETTLAVASIEFKNILRNKTDLIRFLEVAIMSNSKVLAHEDDSFSIGVSHCFNVGFGQHLGQAHLNDLQLLPSNVISTIFNIKKRVILQSAAGTGKSTLLQQLASTCLGGKERLIILLPTTTIALQLSQEFESKGTKVLCLTGETSGYEKDNANQFKIIVGTFDSILILKELELVEKSFLVIDEFHQLANDIHYRDKQSFREIHAQLRKHDRVLMLSATSNYHYALSREIDMAFGFTLIKGTPSICGKINITLVNYKGREKDIPPYVTETYGGLDDGLILGRFNSKSRLHVVKEISEWVEIFYSGGNAKYKEENEYYKSLVNIGFVNSPLGGRKIKQLWATDLIEAGVSIKDNVSLMVLVGQMGWQKVVQWINRPRYNTTTCANEEINVLLFKKEQKEGQKKGYALQKPDGLSWFEFFYKKAELEAERLNDIGAQGVERYTTICDKKEVEITYLRENKWVVCMLGVLKTISIHENLDSTMLLTRVSRFDARVTILEPKSVELLTCASSENVGKLQKVACESSIADVKQLIKTDLNSVAQVVVLETIQQDKKKHILGVLGIVKMPKKDVEKFRNTNIQAFQNTKYHSYVKDICYFVSNKETLKAAIDRVLESDSSSLKFTKSNINRSKNKAAVKEGTAESTTILNLAVEKGIMGFVDELRKNIQKGRIKVLTPLHVLRVINAALTKLEQTNVKQPRAMEMLKDLYVVTQKRAIVNNKKVTAITILGVKEPTVLTPKEPTV